MNAYAGPLNQPTLSQRQIFFDTARRWTATADEIERAGPQVTNELSFHADLKRLMD
jgi:hypothetical protein